jgi:hypothetical protein
MYARESSRVVGAFTLAPTRKIRKWREGQLTSSSFFLSFFNEETDRRRLEMMIHGERTP